MLMLLLSVVSLFVIEVRESAKFAFGLENNADVIYIRNSSEVYFPCNIRFAPKNSAIECDGQEDVINRTISNLTHSVFNCSRHLNRINFSSFSDEYQMCSASVENSSSKSLIYLNIIDFPVPPRKVYFGAINESALLLEWENEINPSLPINYLLELYQGATFIRHLNVSPSLNQTVIGDLESYTNYSLTVSVFDSLGPGNAISSYTACSLPGTPTVSPNISVQSLSNTSVSILFTAPDIVRSNATYLCSNSYLPSSYMNGPFSAFIIHYHVKNESVVEQKFYFDFEIEKKKLHNLTGLTPFTNYSLNISISNGRNSGPIQVVIFRTHDGLPDPPVVFVYNATSESLTISWAPSKNSFGNIINYTIKCRECSLQPAMFFESNQTYFVIKNLSHSSCYIIQVASCTLAGYGNFSNKLKAHTLPLAPPAPILLNATLSKAGIHIFWTQQSSDPSLINCVHFQSCIQSYAKKNVTCTDMNLFSSSRGSVFNGLVSWNSVKELESNELLLSMKSSFQPNHCAINFASSVHSNLSNMIPFNFSDNTAPFGKTALNFDDNAIGALIGSVIVLLMLFCLVPFCLIYWRSTCARKAYELARINGDIGQSRVPMLPVMQSFETSLHDPIPASDFPQHVSSLHADDDAGYQMEFEDIEQCGQTQWPSSFAKLPENMPKNRYSNVFAYDHSRVIIRSPHCKKSDYINANYVDGYLRPKSYIAAQGPLTSTFDDFWQMVWDENSSIIVMISNFVERGRRKCDQYWPTEGQQSYGTVNVRMISTNTLACYVIRVFYVKNLKCKKFSKERIVYHYQYTDWRDFDVPPSPLPVLVFVKSSVSHWSPTTGPIIVHCSAGVGRTGTYICIESLIRQLETEWRVNVRGFLEHIRQQRMKLVQTEQQYAFIHDALREFLVCPEHEISASNFLAYTHCLRTMKSCGCSNLQKQFEICTENSAREFEFIEARKPYNAWKNRSDIIPTDAKRVTLPSEPGVEGSSYINASIVQGYRSLNEFIITQHPLEKTEMDFWKMVWDNNSAFIFILSTENMSPFWPYLPDCALDIGWLHIGFCGSESLSKNIVRFEFLLSSSREDYALTCQLLHLLSWPKEITMESTRDILKLQSLLVSNPASTLGGSIIIVDDVGGNRAGIFCAINFLINQFTLSGVIDVYFISKMLHLQRSNIFKSHEDLDCIYAIMEQFLFDSQQDEAVESYSSGYANLGIGVFKSPPLASQSPLNAAMPIDSLFSYASRCPELSASMEESVDEIRSYSPLLKEVELPSQGEVVKINISSSSPVTPCFDEDSYELRHLSLSCSSPLSVASNCNSTSLDSSVNIKPRLPPIESMLISKNISDFLSTNYSRNVSFADGIPPPPKDSPPPIPPLCCSSETTTAPLPVNITINFLTANLAPTSISNHHQITPPTDMLSNSSLDMIMTI